MLGYGRSERVCIVTVGGSSVGAPLLRRVIAAFPQAKEQVPDLRMIIVAGPRIDPGDLSGPAGRPGLDGRSGLAGLEVRPYVPDLYRHLAVCDLAVVQGGLTTTMELTANRRPFLYFPLGHHFEQSIHVRHRLARRKIVEVTVTRCPCSQLRADHADDLGCPRGAASRGSAASGRRPLRP